MNRYLVVFLCFVVSVMYVDAGGRTVHTDQDGGLSLKIIQPKGGLRVGTITRIPITVKNETENVLRTPVWPEVNLRISLDYLHNPDAHTRQRLKFACYSAGGTAYEKDVREFEPGQSETFRLPVRPVLSGRAVLEVVFQSAGDEQRIRVVKEIPNSRLATTEVKKVAIENAWEGTIQHRIPVKISPGSAKDHDIDTSVLVDGKKGGTEDRSESQIVQLRTLQQLARQRNGIGAHWFAKYLKRQDINSALKNHAYCELLSLALDGVGFKYLPQLLEEAENPNTPLHVRLLLVEGLGKIGCMGTLEEMGHLGKNYIYLGSPEPTRGKIKKALRTIRQKEDGTLKKAAKDALNKIEKVE